MTEPNDSAAVGTVDVEAIVEQLQSQIAAQQKHIEALLAERGIPSDPVAAKIQALQDHVTAQANANPLHAESYDPVQKYVGKLKSDSLTDKQAFKTRTLVESLAEKHPGHELAYARDLARELHTMTLDPEDD